MKEKTILSLNVFRADKMNWYYKHRSTTEKKYWYNPKGVEVWLYLCHKLAEYKDYVVICEGEIDTLTLLQEDINAVGSPSALSFKEGVGKLIWR